jgi:hypothetical protein
MCSKIADAVIEGKTGEAVAPSEVGEEKALEKSETVEIAEPIIFTPDDEDKGGEA